MICLKLAYSERALHDLEKMDGSARKLFIKHIEKIIETPERSRHAVSDSLLSSYIDIINVIL